MMFSALLLTKSFVLLVILFATVTQVAYSDAGEEYHGDATFMEYDYSHQMHRNLKNFHTCPTMKQLCYLPDERTRMPVDFSTDPYRSWYSLTVTQAGDITIKISFDEDNYNIDFAVWGPYNDIDEAIDDCPPGLFDAIDFSASEESPETPHISGAQVGEVYVMVLQLTSGDPDTAKPKYKKTSGSDGDIGGCPATPVPSAEPSAMPSDTPSGTPSLMPSTSPSTMPSSTPSDTPSLMPSSTPSTMPSSTPSETPSLMPSEEPSQVPSAVPSFMPSAAPSAMPSETPSMAPSSMPSMPPTSTPSAFPTTKSGKTPGIASTKAPTTAVPKSTKAPTLPI